MLGSLTKKLIENCCPLLHQQEISELLVLRCSTHLPGVSSGAEWDALIDRVQLAAIRGSNWNINQINENVNLANVDWRDLLMAAEFGEDLSAHKIWQRHALQAKNVS
jgi:hypothetical protein